MIEAVQEATIPSRDHVNPPPRVILELQGDSLAEHGGAPGIHRLGALEASMARPHQLIAHAGEKLTILDLAAAFRAGIHRSHPFIDGDKRAAFLALRPALGLNGFEPDTTEREAADRISRLAGG